MSRQGALQIPDHVRKASLPRPDLTIAKFLKFQFPQSSPSNPNDRNIPEGRLWDGRVSSLTGDDILRAKMPSLDFARRAREGAQAASDRGMHSTVSPSDGRRFPLWVATYWTEAYSLIEIQNLYLNARRFLLHPSTKSKYPRDDALVARLLRGWETFKWSSLHRNLTAGDNDIIQPDPHQLLPIFSGEQWLEDLQMDLLVQMLNMNIQDARAPGLVVKLQFWRELQALGNGQQASTLPCLMRTWKAITRSNAELGFILNGGAGAGNHWTACVYNRARNEFRFGDSQNNPPPPHLRSNLQKWARANGLDTPIRQARYELEHGTQRDGHSCGIAAINTLERYFLNSHLWGPELDMNIRLTNYINLLEHNGPGRGKKIPPPRLGKRSSSNSSSRSQSSGRPENYFPGDDIPLVGDDVRAARGWNPEEGYGEGSRYQGARLSESDRSRSRGSSSGSAGPPLRRPGYRKPPPIESTTAPQIERVQPSPVPKPGYERREVYKDGRIQYDYVPIQPIIPSENADRGPRSSPVMKSQPLQSVPLRFAPTAHRREKAPIPEWDGGPSGFRIKEPVRERLPTGVSGPIYLSKQVSDTPVVHRSEYSYGMDSSSPVFPAPSSHVRSNIPWPRGQVVFPSSSPSSDGPVFPPENLGHHRSNTEPIIPVMSRPRKGSRSPASIWNAVKKRFSRSRSTSAGSSQSVGPDLRRKPESESESDDDEDVHLSRGRPVQARGRQPEIRERKSSLKSNEHGQHRARGLSVTFDKDAKKGPPDKESTARRNISREDARRYKANNPLKSESASAENRRQSPPRTSTTRKDPPSNANPLYASVEYVPIPPGFYFESDAIPPERKKAACEIKYNVQIDVETERLRVTGPRLGVSEALRELYKAVSQFKDQIGFEDVIVSERAANRIGLWALHKRLQEETLVNIQVVKGRRGVIRITGAKERLIPSRKHILLHAQAIDVERRKKYTMSYSRGLRAFLMTELPRIITTSGGPEDEDEARQMFTISNPDERQPLPIDMEIDMWCHPSMTSTLDLAIKTEVQRYTQHVAPEVWMLRVQVWRLHALQNSHIFQPQFKDGSIKTMQEWAAAMQVEIYWPGTGKQPRWTITGPYANSIQMSKTSTDVIVMLRGSHSQAPIAFAELQSRLKKFIQVILRMTLDARFQKPLEGALDRLQMMGVDIERRPLPQGVALDTFECALSAINQADLEAGQKEITMMVERIKRNQPP